jgi:alpha-beta hydrolase superfamily lysophospholipase
MNLTLLMGSLSQNKNREKLAKILPLGNLLVLTFTVLAKHMLERRRKELSDEELRREERRARERRGYNHYKLASHLDNKRYTFCAINEQGERDPLHATLNIIIVHGLRGYGLLYQPFAEFWTKQNYNVIIVDLPGHGESRGERCRIYDMKYSDHCIQSAVVEGTDLNPHAPFGFITFSMGATDTNYYLLNSAPKYIKSKVIGVASLGMPLNVGEATFREAFVSWLTCSRDNILEFIGFTVKHAEKEPPRGKIFSHVSCARDTFLEFCGFAKVDTTQKDVPPWKIFCAPILGRYFSWLKLKELSMDKENISHDAEITDMIWNDPMIYKGPLTAGTGYIILKKARNVAIQIGNGGYKHLGFSTFYGRGEFDTVAKKEHYERAGVQIINYKGRKHELLKGSGNQEIIDDLAAWFKEVVLPTWPLRRQKRAISRKFFKKLEHREKTAMTAI